VAIGDHLRARAIHGEEDVTWIGLTLRVGPDPAWELSPLSSSLYDGVAGLALFFAWLGAATQRSDFTDVARRAAHRIRASMEGRGREELRSIGAFSGRSGGLYVFLEELPRDGIITLPGLKTKVREAWVVDGKRELRVRDTGIQAPGDLVDGPFTVVGIELEGPPEVVR